ncbi:SSS family solute:Na+ symporter [Methylobacterium sp. PvP062]|uniref:Na+/solute symporter n=3 Tax=Methylobacterium radiotolerans TaxID=31998 RepID=B1M723_METRJ|nr:MULTISPECIES: sodium:solute symporter family protein [Methylobacterium]MCX4194564.1 sodium:solute symporter family protein [Methylobacterium organophilum]MCX7335527.1 sodium:solute symporter family protein [Hyphomicrobiales bacterium]ACB26682.1 Na+/solute symporter [Methylobacterium radiotolerans JCM 2831]MBP2496124.1 SSS family solute:Na+ symporter [Methylobacterium sp. PvP105]MBP2504004.1 SSS family solute:Na+ symporter [Methylobacterium sp. PvP109]
MQPNWIVLSLTLAYMAAMGLISFSVRRHARSAGSFTSGGTRYPAFLIGFLLMSEFIGTATSVGTTQTAYRVGVSAAWNVLALAVGFVLYAILLAPRFKELGENTISGALAKAYGRPTKLATSVIMIFALQIVAVSTYAGGGTILAGLLNVDRTSAIVITGIVATLYVSVGGMRSVIYTNVLHAVVKYLGILAAVAFGLSQVGGFDNLRAHVPEAMFAVDTVGWSQIFAWMVAGIGAVFSTQYVIQAINTVQDGRTARQASFYCAFLLVPFGIGAALVGVCAAALLPGIPAIQALPGLIARMDDLLAAIVVAGLAGSLFGTISALSIGAATLLFKDFYHPRRRSEDGTSSLRFVRSMTVLVGLIPIPLAIFAPDILKVTFLAKSLRATLAVLVIFAFYAPRFGTPRAAVVSILVSLVLTIGWFLAGDPGGIDNAYVALVIPLAVMGTAELRKRTTLRNEQVAAP